MARTLRSAIAITNAGVASAMTAVDASASPNGETCPYGTGHRVLHVKTTGTVISVTITDDEGLPATAANRPVVACPATGDTYILLQTTPQSGLLQGGGNVLINYSVATGGTAEILDVTPE